MVWLSARDHIYAYNSTSIHAASSVFLLRCECSGMDKTRRKKRASLVWIGPKGLFTPKTSVFFGCGNSAADKSKPHTFKWEPLADDVFPFKTWRKNRASLVWIAPNIPPPPSTFVRGIQWRPCTYKQNDNPFLLHYILKCVTAHMWSPITT